MSRCSRRLRAALSAAAAATALIAAIPSAASAAPDVPRLDWRACENGFQCATMKVPRDYGQPHGRTLDIAVARRPATDQPRRIGTLFFNFGGPGGDAVARLKAIGPRVWGALNRRFDLVGLDPRGVGESRPAIDCRSDQYTLGVYSQPFATPENIDRGAFTSKVTRYIGRCTSLNPDIFPFVSTANVARDMDQLRRALGERKLNYLGYSYGSFLGATYASLFPDRYRAMVLDGPLDADGYINEPLKVLAEQTQGFERALGRFLQACAAQQDRCGFGGKDPLDAFDDLVDRANAQPIPAGGAQPIDGDDLLALAIYELYDKQFWAELAQALREAAAGDGRRTRAIVDEFYGRNDDGSFDAETDRYFTLSAAEQRYPRDPEVYFEAGEDSWALADHFWWNNGYVELNWGLFPVRARDTFTGPFRVPNRAQAPLVVNTTYDPATPYRGGKRLTRQLGNARMLTMRGDGHTAYPFNSDCIDKKVEAYFNDLVLPAAGTSCRQDVPAFPQASALAAPSPQLLRAQATRRPQVTAHDGR